MNPIFTQAPGLQDIPGVLKLYSNNQWSLAASTGVPVQEVYSPISGEKIGAICEPNRDEVHQLLTHAQIAANSWGQVPLKERTQIMFQFRQELLSNIDKISSIIRAESGKTQDEAKAGIMKGVEILEFALALQNLDQGARMEVSRGVSCEYQRSPLGVVVGITPFNFPAMVPMWMIPLALTVGNSFVWKPSDKTPLTAYFIAECLKKSGLPSGVLSVVNGGVEVVNALIDHPLTKAVGFVGSSIVAQKIYQRASLLGKRVLALGGAKNHIVLLPDADPVLAGQGIADSFTGCAGQRCMAASVLLAVGQVDDLIKKIVERAKATRAGYEMGAIISNESLARLNQAIANAEKSGAKILLDGRNPEVPSEYKNGHWLGPTILDHVLPKTEAACDELFGPIISIIRVSSIKEAMDIENANPYGNACSVFTQNGALAQKVISQARAGMLGINIGVPVPREPFSFGGINDSRFGHGDITGMDGVEFWSQKKKITTKWAQQQDKNWMN